MKIIKFEDLGFDFYDYIEPDAIVTEIIEEVKKKGDQAVSYKSTILNKYTSKLRFEFSNSIIFTWFSCPGNKFLFCDFIIHQSTTYKSNSYEITPII